MTDSVALALCQQALEASDAIRVNVSGELSRAKPAELDDVIQITTASGDEVEIWQHERRQNFVRIKGAARISHKPLTNQAKEP